MTRTFFLSLLVGLAALLSACGPQNQADESGDPLQAWIDAPLHNSAIPEDSYTLIFSGASFGDPIGNFEVLVNGQVLANVDAAYQNNDGEAQYGFAQYDWLPPAPGNYLIEVVAHSGPASSAPAQAQVFVGELGSEGEVAEATLPAADPSLVAIPDQNVNCRYGNSSQWYIADTLFEGVEYSPLGRGLDNLWVRFSGPATNVGCWVFVDNLSLVLDGVETDIVDIPEARLPFVAYPATPTPTSTPTPEPTNTSAPTPTCTPRPATTGVPNC